MRRTYELEDGKVLVDRPLDDLRTHGLKVCFCHPHVYMEGSMKIIIHNYIYGYNRRTFNKNFK